MGRTTVIKKEETDYRKIDRLSYSALSTYLSSPKKFKKKYIDKESIPDETSDELERGSIVDIRLTDAENFDNIYAVCTAPKPTGQLLTFTEYLFTLAKDGVNEEHLREAYKLLEESNGGKVRDKFETVLKNFNDKVSSYFNELVENKDKTVITLEEATLTKDIENRLRTHPNTKDIIKSCNHSKFPILFEVEGIPMKCELDLLEVTDTYVQPYDLKLTSFVDSFIWDGFLKRKYYIQSGLYMKALRTCFPNVEIRPFKFIVADMINDKAPLIYETSEKWEDMSMNGFSIGNKHYKGVLEILEEIDKRISLNIWDISLENYNNNGVVKIIEFGNSETDTN